MAYSDSVKNSVIYALKDVLLESYDIEDTSLNEIKSNFEDIKDYLYNSDEVTGNCSGSYYCNAYEAQQMIFENIEEVVEALEVMCTNEDVGQLFLGQEWEKIDVITRCYFLGLLDVEDVEEELKEEYINCLQE